MTSAGREAPPARRSRGDRPGGAAIGEQPPVDLPDDERGLPVRLRSGSWQIDAPLRLDPDVPIATHLVRLVQAIGIPEASRLSRVAHNVCHPALEHEGATLEPSSTLSGVGVRAGDTLDLVVTQTTFDGSGAVGSVRLRGSGSQDAEAVGAIVEPLLVRAGFRLVL